MVLLQTAPPPRFSHHDLVIVVGPEDVLEDIYTLGPHEVVVIADGERRFAGQEPSVRRPQPEGFHSCLASLPDVCIRDVCIRDICIRDVCIPCVPVYRSARATDRQVTRALPLGFGLTRPARRRLLPAPRRAGHPIPSTTVAQVRAPGASAPGDASRLGASARARVQPSRAATLRPR